MVGPDGPDGDVPGVATRDARALTAAVLAEEERRHGDAVDRTQVVLPDDLLPGVGDESLPLRAAVRAGGAGTLVTVGSARLVDWFDNTALAVLAPDIQASLGASDAVMGAIAGAFGVLFLLGSIPVSTLADRYPRKVIATVSMAAWAAVVMATAVVQNAFWLFVARLGTGISQSYALPVNGPLLMDTYPIPARSRATVAGVPPVRPPGPPPRRPISPAGPLRRRASWLPPRWRWRRWRPGRSLPNASSITKIAVKASLGSECCSKSSSLTLVE